MGQKCFDLTESQSSWISMTWLILHLNDICFEMIDWCQIINSPLLHWYQEPFQRCTLLNVSFDCRTRSILSWLSWTSTFEILKVSLIPCGPLLLMIIGLTSYSLSVTAEWQVMQHSDKIWVRWFKASLGSRIFSRHYGTMTHSDTFCVV